MSTDIFTNEKYRVLSYLYDNKDNKNLVKITQTELCEELDLSRSTINTIFKILKENDYLLHDETRVGRYYLTDRAINTIRLFRKANKE